MNKGSEIRTDEKKSFKYHMYENIYSSITLGSHWVGS